MLPSVVLALALLGGMAPGAPAEPVNPFAVELDAEVARMAAAHGKPEAVVPLLALAGLEDDVAPGAVAAALRRIVEKGGEDPLVAAHAAHMLALAEERAGDEAAAARARAALGLVTHFMVVGPFDNAARAGYQRPFAPETEPGPPDPARRYPGKTAEVTWRSAAGAVRQGALLVDALLRPDAEAAAYLSAYVWSDRARDAALRLGTPGPVKAWLNGRLVHARDVVRSAVLDQDATPVRLRRGWNRLLLKTCIGQGAWRLYVRLTDGAGRALPGVRDAETGGPLARAEARERRPAPVRSLGALLRARAAGGDAGALADLGRTLAALRAEGEASDEAVMALRRAVGARPDARTFEAMADATRDPNEQRRSLESALDAATEPATRGLLLARLGDLARSARRERVARERWRDALAVCPGCYPAALGLAAEARFAGLPSLALSRLDGLPSWAASLPRVRRERLRAWEALGRRADADRERAALADETPGDADLERELAEAAFSGPAPTRAVGFLERAVARRPDVPSLALELARALEGRGEAERARATLAQVAERMPGEPRVHEELGKLLHRMGRLAEARAQIDTALALKPQSPELRRYADSLVAEVEPSRARAGEELARRFAGDARALAAARLPLAGPQAEPAVVLLDRRAVRVHANGLSETFAQRVVEIRSERGAREQREFVVRYTPGDEDVDVREARVFRRGADGGMEIRQASGHDDVDLSEPDAAMYYDVRGEVVRWDGLRDGDVVEVQYVVSDVASRNEMADYFGDLETIAEGVPKLRWEYTVIAPAARPLWFNEPRVPGLERRTSEEGGDRVYAFAASGVAKVEPEPAMPGYTEVSPYLHVSTYRAWDEIGAWYWRLVEDQLVPDEAVREAARGVLRPGMTDEAKVAAVHKLVVEGTRYVALEFGIHGFKPYRVSQVLARRFGDCKDKASLLVALLREAGLDAEIVLVRTRHGGRVDPVPASLAVFDHAIAYVPKLDLYLDGTAEWSGLRELPAEDQGVMALRVSARGATLVQTPVLPSTANLAARRWEVDVDATGAGRVVEELTVTGEAARDWRKHYQTPGERLDRYGKVWRAHYPAADISELDMPRIEDRSRPVHVRAVVHAPGLGQAAGPGRFALPSSARDADLVRSYARLSARRLDLELSYPWRHEETLVYRLPPGFEVERLPAPRTLETDFGTFRLETEASDGGVRVHSSLDVRRRRFSPHDYPAFRRFLGDVDEAMGERVLIARRGGA